MIKNTKQRKRVIFFVTNLNGEPNKHQAIRAKFHGVITAWNFKFIAKRGEVITLLQPSVKIEDRVYVPMQFFTDVFGMRNVYYKNGHIFIYD